MKIGLKSYFLTVFVGEKVRTSVAKSSHVAQTSLLYLSLTCFIRLQYKIASNKQHGAKMTLVVVLYLEQLIQKLKVFG